MVGASIKKSKSSLKNGNGIHSSLSLGLKWKRLLRHWRPSKCTGGGEEEEEEEDESCMDIDNDAYDKNKSNNLPRPPSWRCYSYHEICMATNNFHNDNFIGRGGYADVYKGELHGGKMIAVKRLSKASNDENKEKDFLTELGIIGHVWHSNVASLLGCCIENGLYLVFPFYVNGSLASLLHGSGNVMEWKIRYKVAIGTAKGLHYLHKCCQRRIIHRDIKASNVLLGPDFEAQISDFGLAKWLPKQWTHHSVTPIEGTFGYLAPEYFLHGIVDEKTDVFAYGVLLLEMISGRRPVDDGFDMMNIVSWARPLIDCGDYDLLVDPKLNGHYDVGQLHRMCLVASACVRQSAIWRPSMMDVLGQLIQGEVEFCYNGMPEERVVNEEDVFWGFDESETEVGSLKDA